MNSSKASKLHFRKSSDLTVHPFVTLVLQNTPFSRKGLSFARFVIRLAAGLEPEFENSKEPLDKWDIPSFPEETDEEKYRQNVAQYMIAITELIDRLEAIQIYLSFTSFLSNKLKANQISVEEWLKYHYSNYILTSVSIYDTALCLFNVTAQLNIEQRLGFEEKIRNKIEGHNEYYNIKSSLDNIKSKVHQNRTPRNSFIHSGKIPSHDELALITFTEFYSFGSQYSDKENKETIQLRKEWANQEATKGLNNELEKETEDICHLILALFSALQPIYEQNLIDDK